MRLTDFYYQADEILITDGTFDAFDDCTTSQEHLFLGYVQNEKYFSNLNSNLTCLICAEELKNLIPNTIHGLVLSKEPKATWQRLYNQYAKRILNHIEKRSTVIGKNCYISPMAVIDPYDVIIGDDVVIDEFAVIKSHTTILNHCKIHTGVIVGGDAFTQTRSGENDVEGMVALGHTVIEEYVELYPYTFIANAILPYQTTVIGNSSKIDTFVYIGHGVHLKERVFIGSGAKIGGNSIIGRDVWIGINATISNRMIVNDFARVSLGSVVTQSVNTKETVTGNFAIKHSTFIKNLKKSLESETK